MKKILLVIVVLFFATISNLTFAVTINIYEKPESDSKILTKMKSGEQLMPIFYTEKKDWVKVANPKNGDVGWAKVSELKGPVIITKINGTETRQQIITGEGDKKQPQIYNFIQYSGTQNLSTEDVKKMVKNMEEQNRKMEKSMHKMQEQMQREMLDMLKKFDKSF